MRTNELDLSKALDINLLLEELDNYYEKDCFLALVCEKLELEGRSYIKNVINKIEEVEGKFENQELVQTEKQLAQTQDLTSKNEKLKLLTQLVLEMKE